MLKRLMGSLREYKRYALLAPGMVIFEVILEVLIPLLMAMIIDRGIDGGDMPFIWRIGLLMILATACSLLFGALSGRYAAKAAAGFSKNLRRDMFYNIQNFTFSSLDRLTTPSLITRLTSDVTNVQNAFQMMMRMAVRSPIMFVFAMIMAFTINAKLATVFALAAPILGIGLYLIIRRVHPVFVSVFKRYDDLNTVVQENLRGIRVVKSFVRESFEKEKFGERSLDIYNLFVRAERILALNNPLMQVTIYACILLISWLGARMIVGGEMTTGELMSMFAYAMQILFSLMMLSMVFVMIIISRASTERIVEVLSEGSDIVNGPNPVGEVKDGSITFKQVDFGYSSDPDKLALKQISFQLGSGQTLGIIGGTGSAKSSLVHLIPRLYEVTSGKVEVGGVDVRDYDLATLRSEVAMVLQKNVLFTGTIKENLRWGNKEATDEELVRVCKLAQADDFIQSFPEGYDTVIDQGGSNVSGGQKQRLCIARALLKKPKVLILDDSTSAVDTKTEAALRESLQSELPSTTKIIIAQRISSVRDADLIVVLDEGTIHGIGTHDELLANNDIYREVYESQLKGEEADEVHAK